MSWFQQVMPGTALVVYYALLGAAVLFFSFKIFDWAMTRIDMEEEIKNGNIAVAIVAASVILGLSAIIAVAIHG